MGGTSFLLEGEEHSALCSPVGALRSGGGRGGELVPRPLGAESSAARLGLGGRGRPEASRFCSPASPPWSFRTELLPFPLRCEWAPASPHSPKRVFFACPGWEAVSRNPLCLPSHLGERSVHTTPQPVSTARKTSMEQPPPPNPSSFRRKGFWAGAGGSAPLRSGRRSLSRSPSQHPTARAPPPTYSPGPC